MFFLFPINRVNLELQFFKMCFNCSTYYNAVVCSINDKTGERLVLGLWGFICQCPCLLKTIQKSCCLHKTLVFLWVAQHEMEVAELCMYVMQMHWVEEGAHLLYSFYSHFSIKEKWDFGEIGMWGERSQKGGLKKAHFMYLAEGVEGKGREDPVSFDAISS